MQATKKIKVKQRYVTLDDFLKGLQESSDRFDAKLEKYRQQQEADRQKREEQQEADRKKQEAVSEAARQKRAAERKAEQDDWNLRMKDLDKRLGKVTNSLGDIVEYLLSPGICKEFRAMGYSFNEMTRDHVIEAPDGTFLAEIDAELHNGKDVMLVEIKTQPTQKHVNEYIKKMEYIRSLNKFPGKTLMAGMAGAVFKKEVERYTIKCGLYVIKQSGDTMEVVPKDRKFKPRKW